MPQKTNSQLKDNLESFFNAIKDFLFVLDLNGNILHVNSTVTDRLGYKLDELVGQSVLFVHPKNQHNVASKIVKRMIKGEEDYCFIPLLTKNGDLISVETTISSGNWNGEKALFGVSKDITQLQKSEEKFASAFEASAALMAISTVEEGRFIDVNHAFIEKTGYSRKEVIGKTSADLNLFVSLEQREKVKKIFETQQSIRDISVKIKNKKGHILHGLFSVNKVNVGTQNCWLTVMTDVSELVKLNRKQEELLATAERSSKAKSMFVANMSHEIKTPLTAILGYAQILESKCAGCPKKTEGLSSIVKSGEHLLELINNILETIKSEVHTIKLNETTFDFMQMIQELISMFIHRPDAKNIKISTQFGPDFPKYIYSDKGKVRQVLINLIGNAFKFTDKGNITILAEQLKNEITNSSDIINLRISIKDTGFGIAKEQQELIFDPFEQSESGYKKGIGTGLGLPLSRKYALALGGNIKVKSELSVGSTFSFTFQTKRVLKSDSKPKTYDIAKIIGKSPKILVVDDDKFNLEMLYRMLKNTGFEIYLSNSGKAAIKLVRKIKFDSVLLDQCMPDMDGTETLRNIRALPGGKSIPVIIITASEDVDAEKMICEGANAFIRKPFSRFDLLKKIQIFTGVTYEYLYNESNLNNKTSSKLSHDIKALSVSQRKKILSLIEDGDILNLRKMIDDIDSKYSKLAKKLRSYIKKYDYDGLCNFIGDI